MDKEPYISFKQSYLAHFPKKNINPTYNSHFNYGRLGLAQTFISSDIPQRFRSLLIKTCMVFNR